MWTLFVDFLGLLWRGVNATLGRLVVWASCVWMRWIMKRPWWAP
jgi:hypothetical protein